MANFADSKSLVPSEERPLLTSVPSSARETYLFGLNEQIYGYLLMALSSLGFGAVTFIAHLLGSSLYGFNVPPLFIVWCRSVIQVFAAVAYLFSFVDDVPSTFQAITRERAVLLTIRGACGTAGFICLYKALALLPLGIAVTLFFLSPLLTALLTSITMGEPISSLEGVASVASFIGVVLVANPSWSGPQVAASDTTVWYMSDHARGALLAISAAFFGAFAYTLIRKLGGRVHFVYNVFALGAVAALVTTGVLRGELLGLLRKSIAEPVALALLIMQGCFAFLGQCLLTKALQHCSGLGVMIRNIDIPLSYALGIFLLGETPTWHATAGTCLVLLATGAISFRQAVRSTS